MEQLLKPDKLDLDPQAGGASVLFDHWLHCFETFIASSSSVVSDIDKLHVLHARVGAHVYAMIRDAETYQGAIDLLKGQYKRQMNEIQTPTSHSQTAARGINGTIPARAACTRQGLQF